MLPQMLSRQDSLGYIYPIYFFSFFLHLSLLHFTFFVHCFKLMADVLDGFFCINMFDSFVWDRFPKHPMLEMLEIIQFFFSFDIY